MQSVFQGRFSLMLLSVGLFAVGIGCAPTDRPHDYGQQRPSVDDVDERDSGLQSRDVNQAADKMAAELLSHPGLNASKEQWMMVVVSMEDKTSDKEFATNFDIFLQALKARLFKQGQGRVTLVTNRDKFYDLRNKELEPGGKEPFGQGDGGNAGGLPLTPVTPDYALTGVVIDLPNRGTIYYQMEFTAVDLKRRVEAWTGTYEVKVAR